MSRVPSTLPPSTPSPLVRAWNQIEINAMESFNHFIIPVLSRMPRPVDLELLAAKCGYIPAEQHALTYRGSPYNNMTSSERANVFVDPIIQDVIKPFLIKKDFSTSECLQAMNNVMTMASNVPDFMFGNAQKWINMSIKYYLILLAFSAIPTNPIINYENWTNTREFLNHRPLHDYYSNTKFYDYKLMPIDTPMCKHITADFGTLPAPVYTPYPWSRNNNQCEFEDYWRFVDISLAANPHWAGFIPLLYEIFVW